ncbi:tetratricopeptide repeat protein [Hansschlegelia zhihuaiae]|uniref:Tetratricopeptide repeat protein n=1 Tax=Hansschlegelia zhihuaiae TaxID=405005 RepID=A0A4Q0M582_9HYPH|nr:tetratricopeptide repeat protein [Hansschlegelia zhihuaiae]RXF67816.1 tetratricopeptide repeat protein [Hansschlegelia zhihuaiae]
MARSALLLGVAVIALVVTTPAERIGRALYEAGAPRLAGPLLDGQVWDGATLYAQGRFAEAAAAFRGAPFEGAEYNGGTALARAGRLPEAIRALEAALQQNPNDEDARYNLALVEALKAKRDSDRRETSGAANADAAQQKRAGAENLGENDMNSTGEGMAGDRDSGREAQSSGRAQVARTGRAEQSRVDERGGQARGSVGASEGGGRTGRERAKVAESFEQLVKLPKKSYSQQTVFASPQWLETLSDEPGRYLRFKLEAERERRAERGVAAPSMTDPW